MYVADSGLFFFKIAVTLYFLTIYDYYAYPAGNHLYQRRSQDNDFNTSKR